MRNKAKCKLCQEIIESFHSEDYVICKCGQIAVFGGDSMKCAATSWDNFLRIDDNDKEISVTTKDTVKKVQKEEPISYPPLNKKDLINQLHEMVKYIETLPPHAMSSPITHYDLFSLSALLLALFRVDCKDEI